ncbi:cytochrome c peroxidase [Neptunitalea lumnitzerae]|uniref:Cytochrome-c peroxidase n=1 Tax=Neptunitalea lumnitzerae TaxID=2965509 RepID=A0ABQ5MFM4_9FLAO|nr:cytochrome c peroxidase [Neptunitalea sp. Y10]GLB48203.1 cytochrome-c peroxidase [Neptunitalea sp. Y10]
MKTKSTLLFALIALTLITGCKKQTPEYETTVAKTGWENAHAYYLQNLDSAMVKLNALKAVGAAHQNSKQLFTEARLYFKKAEPFASYLNPEVGHQANGPALPVFKDDNNRVMAPIGLQKIEEGVYEGETAPDVFTTEVEMTIGLLNVLRKNIVKRELTPKRFFVATHQQLLRIISFSITGFDTPVSNIGLHEAEVSLLSLQQLYGETLAPVITEKDNALHNSFNNNIKKAVAYLQNHTNFAGFDRYTFIRDYMNPITRNWVAIRKTSNLWEGSLAYPFNFDAPTFFENNSFNTAYFLPPNNSKPTNQQIALGKKLFYDENLSSTKNMSCITCHDPEKAYTDGRAISQGNKGQKLQRNAPTLINSIFQKSYFLDGRSETIADQITSVFNNKDEFDTDVHQFSDAILEDTTYIKMFENAYGKIPSRNTVVIKALSAYMSTLNGFNAKFDRNIRGEENTFTPEEQLGFNLFAGKALCATCHFIPLTNGTVPPFFNNSEKEVIGVPETADNTELDDDTGFYWYYKVDLHKGMFKTPTVRNAAQTAPYMHNGVYTTLEQVVDFYNKGGGGGLGFDLPYQTLPFDNLELTETEQKALVAFMKTLTDTNVEGTH